jgi:acetylornithine deacetylase/succinyl-diaminopimelate desuccinylase-like protein
MLESNSKREKQVLDFLTASREVIIAFTGTLISTPSQNPPGDERHMVEVIRQKLTELSLPAGEVIAELPERPNLIVRLPGVHRKPVLMLAGHMDTKPVGEEARILWRTDPLTPTQQDGRLYGLGAGDMKAGLAAMVFAAAALNQLIPKVGGDLLLAFLADEEATTGHGAKYIVHHRPFAADFGLVAESCGLQSEFESLPLFGRGSYHFKVKIYGDPMHASIADQFDSVNASVKMAWVLWRMAHDLRLNHPTNPAFPKGPTITPGATVQGGQGLGSNPSYAEFSTDLRLLPGMTFAQAQMDIDAFLNELRREDPALRVETELISAAIQGSLRGDESFVKILVTASEQVLGRTLSLGGYPAFTDAYWFNEVAGIPTIPAFGPGLLPLAHSPNEYVPVQGILNAAKIYALAALRYLELV